jgi:hypothetical protein
MAGRICIFKFGILIDNEIHGRNISSIREPGGSKKISANMEVHEKYGRVGHPRSEHCAHSDSVGDNMVGIDKLTIQNRKAALAQRHRDWPCCCCVV